jgi:hypothetical protein
MRDGQLLEKQEIDKMYVHFTSRPLFPSQLSLAVTSAPSLFKEDTTSCAPYVAFFDPLRDIGTDTHVTARQLLHGS